MDKSNHRITVNREYLEELEQFREENTTEKNAKLSLRNTHGYAYSLFLEVGKDVNQMNIVDLENLIVLNEEGRELARFRKQF